MVPITLVAQAPQKPSLTIPEAALDLFTDLDCRGLVCAELNGQLRISRKDGDGPPDLSPHERDAIKLWKLHLLALVAYCHEEPTETKENRRKRNRSVAEGSEK